MKSLNKMFILNNHQGLAYPFFEIRKSSDIDLTE